MKTSVKWQHKMLHILIAEIILGIAVNLLSLFIFFKLANSLFEKEVALFDNTIITVVYAWRTPWLTQIMKIFSLVGGPALVGAALLIAVFFAVRRHLKRSLFFFAVFATGAVLNLALKDMFHRPRPDFLPLVHESSYSFPSGHAMNSFIFYMSVAYLYFHYTQNQKKGILVAICASVLVFLIGLSRVYLGVHFPSDVIAGYFGGLWWFVAMLVFEKVLEVEYLFEKRKH